MPTGAPKTIHLKAGQTVQVGRISGPAQIQNISRNNVNIQGTHSSRFVWFDEFIYPNEISHVLDLTLKVRSTGAIVKVRQEVLGGSFQVYDCIYGGQNEWFPGYYDTRSKLLEYHTLLNTTEKILYDTSKIPKK